MLKYQNMLRSLEIPLNKPFSFVPVPLLRDSDLLPDTFQRVCLYFKFLFKCPQQPKGSISIKTTQELPV